MKSQEATRPIKWNRAVPLSLTLALAAMSVALLAILPQATSAHTDNTMRNRLPGPIVDAPQVPPHGSALQTAIIPGSTFTFATGADVVGLDPALVTDGRSYGASKQIYETLVDYQPGTTILIPGLAESWNVSSNGLTWTFTLRAGVKFHDGTDLNAAAVQYNLERWWDPAHPYHNGSFDYFAFMFGGFKGDPNCLISGVGTIGDDQVQIVLKEPYSPLPYTLVMYSFAIASPTAIQAGTLATTPVGTGPFKFVEWVTGDHIRLTGNTAYWGDGPYLETLTFQVIADEASRFAAVRSNAVQGIGDISWSYVPAAASDPHLRVVWKPSLNVGYLGINRGHSPLDNSLVRQAIAHAINKQAIVDNYYNIEADGGQVAGQLLPPTVWGYNTDLTDYAYDPGRSRSLLAQAGYANGLTTTLWIMSVARPYFPRPSDVGFSIQADLQTVGITATLVMTSWSAHLAEVNSGKADLFMLGWTGDSGHPDNFFSPLICDNYRRYGPRDDTLCDQLQAAREESDFDTWVGLYEQIGQQVHDTLPLAPIAHTRTPLILRDNVVGLVPAVLGAHSFQQVFLAGSRADSWIDLSPGVSRTLVYTDAGGTSTRIAVPPGAVTGTTVMVYTSLVSPTHSISPMFGFANHAFALEAYVGGVLQAGLVFSQPITVTIHYSDADIVEVDESTLALYYWNSSQWADAATTCTPPSAYGRHLGDNWLAVPICHLSDWALLGSRVYKIYLPLIIK